ncbi:MAG TPA: pyridoxamine 5'-phosphate oxidase family protein [Candidatus Dormibacteraeota bacterium]
MQLDPQSGRLLGSARIGMLALHAGRFPLVNPAAFVYQGGSVWITTSRFAAKFALARRDPRAAFLVTGGDRSVELQGLLEAYDLRSPAGMLRAATDAPRFGLAMAGYTLKNAGFIGGYLVDLAGIPREWWPWNRVVLRLKADHYRTLVAGTPARAARSGLEGMPAAVARSLETQGTGFLCWSRKGYPSLAPALWAAAGPDLACWLPEGLAPPREGTPAGLVVESHHRYRATRMLGACLRGLLRREESMRPLITARYGDAVTGGAALRLEARRATYWRGFAVATTAVGARVAS